MAIVPPLYEPSYESPSAFPSQLLFFSFAFSVSPALRLAPSATVALVSAFTVSVSFTCAAPTAAPVDNALLSCALTRLAASMVMAFLSCRVFPAAFSSAVRSEALACRVTFPRFASVVWVIFVTLTTPFPESSAAPPEVAFSFSDPSFHAFSLTLPARMAVSRSVVTVVPSPILTFEVESTVYLVSAPVPLYPPAAIDSIS